MKKITVNYIIDFLAILSFFVISTSGAVLYFIFSKGSSRGGVNFLGLVKSEWITIHDWGALVLTILILIHFLMHWSWFVDMSKNIFRR
ncbi:MAG: DUF4405 domain-containing protein [Candidatus Pacebacteria bacterium]|nr:DUF4405 domain-containing protein [Candidatus Paceibacterota bacterium]MDD3919328.1 DUF4405 domain-containing protein [Candidatus Paceibacterota bacterium]